MAKDRTPRAPRRTGSDPQGTRDARDDATMIQWLSKIDTDLVSGLKQPLLRPSGAGGSGADGDGVATAKPRGPTDDEKEKQKAEKEAAKTFAEMMDVLKRTLGQFAGVVLPFVNVLRDLATIRKFFFPTPSPAESGATRKTPHETAQEAVRTAATNLGSGAVRRIGQALAGTTAEHEFSFSSLKEQRPGFGESPEAGRGQKRTSEQAARILAEALASRGAASMAASAAGASAGAGAAGAGAGVAAAGGAAGLAAPGLGTVILVAGAALAVLTAATMAAGQAMSNLNRQLAEFSPHMAAVFGAARFREVQRGMRTGEGTAASAGFLEQGLQNLKDTLAPIGIILRNIFNVIVGVVVRILDLLLKPISMIADGINKILQKLGLLTPAQKAPTLGQWMEEIRDDYEAAHPGARQSRPGRGLAFGTSGGDF